jgi:hypothetical protein
MRAPYRDIFSAGELALVDEVIKDLWGQTAEEVSDASHDIVWRGRQDQEDIPYEAVYLSNDPLTEDDIRRSKELAKELGWLGD